MRRYHRRARFAAPALLIALLGGAMPMSTTAIEVVDRGAPTLRTTTTTTTPFATWGVPVTDIADLGTVRSELIVKAFSPSHDIIKFLDTAKAHKQQVLVYFENTVDYNTGTVYPARIKSWVDKVKAHSALFGYLSVKEPSWSGVTLSEMRSLYNAYRAADPKHPVVALLGDVPHFGTSANPWGSGVANVLWVNWYPVTYTRGYIATASTHFPKVRAYVDKVTPGTKIWLMVQGHGYRPGDRKPPTTTQLVKQIKDGFQYLKADGIAFHAWYNPPYDSDFSRNATLWSSARTIMAKVRAGTF